MVYFRFLLFSTLVAFYVIGSAHAQYPNIVYILADDMGYGDVSVFNPSGRIRTAHIDQIANQGMICTDAHTNSSVCTPTRYGILTGRYAWRTELKNGVLSGNSEHLIDTDRLTVASLLKNQGYATAVIGKWHLGMDWQTVDNQTADRRNGENVNYHLPAKISPLQYGFDYFFGLAGSLNMTPHAYVENNLVQAPLEYLQDDEAMRQTGLKGIPGWWGTDYRQDQVLSKLADKSISWIKGHLIEKEDQPFFLYLPLTAPHAPIVPSSGFVGESGIGSYGDYCMEVDHIVGRILDFLEEMNVADHTLLIFTADNGCSPQAKFANLQEQGHYPSYIYRGLKGSLYEGGHRVPFLVKWPGVIEPGTTSDVVMCTTDLLATVADIFDVALPQNAGEDSYSMLKVFKGEHPLWTRSRGVVHHSDAGHFSIRVGKWKLIIHEKGGTRRQNPKGPPVINPAGIQLFDMRTDPEETTNIQHLHPGVVKELALLLIQYIESGRSTPGDSIPVEEDRGWSQLEAIYKLKNGL